MSEEKQEQKTENQLKESNIKSKLSINTLLNLLTLAGLIVLYVLYFTGFEKSTDIEPAEIKAIERTVSDATLKIGFINSDELMAQYHFAKKLRDDMSAERRRLENDITRRQRDFQQRVEDFQSQMQRGLMSMDQAQIKEQELLYEQQELMMLSEDFSDRLRKKEITLNIELFDSISSFVKRYNKEFGFDFVFNYSPGGAVLFGGEQFDITEDFIEKINK